MKNYFQNTTNCIIKYNNVIDTISHGLDPTTDDEDEFIINFCIYLAHALIKDYGDTGQARDELLRCVRIIEDVIIEGY